MARRKLHPFILGGRLQFDVAAILRTGFLREEHQRLVAEGYKPAEKATVRVRADATVEIPIRWRRGRACYTSWLTIPIAAFFAASPPPPAPQAPKVPE